MAQVLEYMGNASGVPLQDPDLVLQVFAAALEAGSSLQPNLVALFQSLPASVANSNALEELNRVRFVGGVLLLL